MRRLFFYLWKTADKCVLVPFRLNDCTLVARGRMLRSLPWTLLYCFLVKPNITSWMDFFMFRWYSFGKASSRSQPGQKLRRRVRSCMVLLRLTEMFILVVYISPVLYRIEPQTNQIWEESTSFPAWLISKQMENKFVSFHGQVKEIFGFPVLTRMKIAAAKGRNPMEKSK